MTHVLLFWNAGPAVRLSPPEICRELTWGEDVPGLIDLPVRQILDRWKAEFPRHQERSGEFVGYASAGAGQEESSFAATWSWQHMKVECRGLSDEDRQRLIDAVGHPAYEPPTP